MAKTRSLVIKNNHDLAAALKSRRKELGVSQKELAQICNLSHNGISRIEVADSDTKLSTLLKMGKFLGFHIKFEMEDS